MQSTEKPKRLQPLSEVLRQLFLKSGNICAYPNCSHLMMNEDGDFIGQICHIEAAEEGGERFNPNMSNEERRSFENLMLMCYEHHTITNDVEKYTVQKLKEFKSTHEQKFSDPSRAMLKNLKDWTVANDLTLPVTFNRLKILYPACFDEDDIKRISSFINSFKTVPDSCRKFLGLLAQRAKILDVSARSGGDSVRLLLSDVEASFRLSEKELKSLIEISERHGFAYYDSDESEEIVLQNWSVWSSLVDLVRADKIDLDQFTVYLQFHLLD